MAGTGGARPGAGRKPKEEKHATAISEAEQKIVDKLPLIVNAMTELALGVTVQEVDEDTGGVNVYTKKPEFKAGQYLMDRIMGKPVLKIKDEDAEDKISVYGQLIREMRIERGLEEPDPVILNLDEPEI